MFFSILGPRSILTRPITTAMNNSLKKSAVLYHYPCPDGTFAALAAHLYFTATSTPALFFPNTVYNPITTNQLPLHELRDVYLLDFVGPSGFVQDLSSKVENVIVLDHHKTALDALGGDTSSLDENVTTIIDMNRSGATIAFDFFKNKPGIDEKTLSEFVRMRKMYDYIEDADLWKWRLENSKAFSSGLKDSKIEFDYRLNPLLFQQLLSLNLESVISQGKISLTDKQKRISEALKESFEIALGEGQFGHSLAVNVDEALSQLRSELGNQLACKSQDHNLRGIGAIVYKVPELENDEKVKISLRSVKHEDTTPISEKYGGGGHRNASSFMLSSVEFERWKVRS